MRVPSKDGIDAPLKVELLDLRPDGYARARLWYHKWRKTRPDQPYADVVFKPKKRGIPYIGKLLARGGITVNHLVDIVLSLGQMGIRGVYLKGRVLYFTPKFLYTAIARLGAPVGPAQVEYLGEFKFSIDGHTVEFRREFIASQRIVRGYGHSLSMKSVGEALYLFARLKAAGVWAEVNRAAVNLDVDSLMGLMVATGALPPGFGQLHASEDLSIYDEVSGHYYIAIQLGGVWRAVWGKFSKGSVELKSKSFEVAEAVWHRVRSFLRQLGAPDDVKPPRRIINAYAFPLYLRHLAPILRHAGEGPAEVVVNNGKVKIKAEDVEVEVAPGERFIPLDLQKAHRLHKALMVLGIPTMVKGGGLRLSKASALALLAVVADGAELPKEVAPGIALVYRHVNQNRTLYVLLRGYDTLCFVVGESGMWRARCGTFTGYKAELHDDGTLMKALNDLYRQMGISRTLYYRNGAITLTSVDLKLLGIWQTLLKLKLDWIQREFLSKL